MSSPPVLADPGTNERLHPRPGGARPQGEASPWIDSARFLSAWLSPALLGLYLKWYLMVDEGGLARETRRMGQSLGLASRLGFFRGELLIGFLAVPLFLLCLGRYVPTRWKAVLAGTLSGTMAILVGIQLFALRQFGRFSTLAMARLGLGWGWHEPGSNLQYLASRETVLLIASLAGTTTALAWSIKRSGGPSKPTRRIGKTAGELYLFVIVATVLFSLRSDVTKSPYQESSFVRSAVSLWGANTLDTGEFAGYDFQRKDSLATADLSSLSEQDLVSRYQELTHAPETPEDARYFGKQKGSNVLFFVLETTPETYLPAEDDMKQFPNMGRLRANSFVGVRHYTTFPFTRCALFSAFTSWYPIDDPQDVFGLRKEEVVASGFVPRLASLGYETDVFSPIRGSVVPDASLFSVVGFEQQNYPDRAISDYDRQPSWKQARVGADLATLRSLEEHLDLWMTRGRKFVAAFLPQVGHFPYPDSDSGSGPEDLRRRGRAVLAMEDAWLGELIKVLESHGELHNTIIVIFGDHGPRTIEENPGLRRGTIDEVAFHVPLLIYAPRALDHTEQIPWLTSHIDLVPTVLDLLGEKGARKFEQGSPIWNPALAGRTTFFFAKPMFGADGYTTAGEFLMWHYLSDAVYQNSAATFDSSEIVPRQSKVTKDVMLNILQMVALERAWHAKFSKIGPPRKMSARESKPGS